MNNEPIMYYLIGLAFIYFATAVYAAIQIVRNVIKKRQIKTLEKERDSLKDENKQLKNYLKPYTDLKKRYVDLASTLEHMYILNKVKAEHRLDLHIPTIYPKEG